MLNSVLTHRGGADDFANEMIKSEIVFRQSENDDILLNNFQIKKKRYKVLLNCDHIVWERLDAKYSKSKNNDRNNKQKPLASALPISNPPSAIQKEAEYEKEHLSDKAVYDFPSNILYIRDVIRVAKGATKSASIRNAYIPLESAESHQVTTPTEQYLSIYYAERIVSSPTDCNRWRIRRLTLNNNDPYLVAKWYDHLQKLLRKDTRICVRRLLVFINPYGGRKMGLQIYERNCKEIIQLAGIDASCVITQRANQIRDILMTHDLTPYDAVCCVGGDGTVAEMINGLIWRAMRDKDLDLRKPDYIPKPSLPVGIIPAGSTDTIVYSIHGTSDAQTAAIHLVLGQRRGLDICSVRNREGILRFCTSVMGYGYLGDVAAKSEKYRWMGTKRYEYTGVKTFLLNRGYEAEVHLLLNDDKLDNSGSTTTISAPYEDNICHAYCQKCKNTTYKSPSNGNDDDDDNDGDKPKSSNSSLYAKQTTNNDNNLTKLNENSQESYEHSDYNICDKSYSKPVEIQTQIKDLIDDRESTIKRISSPSINVERVQEQQQQQELQNTPYTLDVLNNDPKKWRVIHGEFFMITGTNITCACTRSPNGISRYCHLGDGQLDVVLVRKTNIFNNIRLVINTMGRSGDIRNLPFVEIYRTRQFMFKTKSSTLPQDYSSVRGSCQPINESYSDKEEIRNSSKLFSSWNCDGEVVSDLEITMTSHRQLLDVFMRGPYIYSKPPKNMENKSALCFCCHSQV